ncbi:MAG: hypothetical protein K9N09_07035 [Candidatus Cloacimonetes bacterium]|nr:hypothetical protein [Candidatus Cloacimonadota bacterium]MCF7814232.1 hypothetical protein [Candidatus Cloacimonadota bacterium]MCF7868439.1 hypothetical protein [Candidatus Cloacimonadota bacterium]MCF7883941.1 hypothetical protein [Candidatus Cloacimonadota bacterium]
MSEITIEISADMMKELNDLCEERNILINDFALLSLKKNLVLAKFRKLRKMVQSYAQKAGIVLDNDVFELLNRGNS